MQCGMRQDVLVQLTPSDDSAASLLQVDMSPAMSTDMSLERDLSVHVSPVQSSDVHWT